MNESKWMHVRMPLLLLLLLLLMLLLMLLMLLLMLMPPPAAVAAVAVARHMLVDQLRVSVVRASRPTKT